MKALKGIGILFLFILNAVCFASEVIDETPTRVLVREHPKTRRPYISIVSNQQTDADPLQSLRSEKWSRPDYRMLDPKVKSGQIPYEGPVSDRKKVYLLAGSLAAAGVAGAALLPMAPIAASAGSGAGAGAYAAGGAAVGAGTVSASVLATQPDPDKDRVTRIAKSEEIK